jgi:type IV secretory pathway TraG/TraD family ATPase VirD4
MPDEVMRVPEHKQLVFLQNQPPMKPIKINYLSNEMFIDKDGKKMFDSNPYYKD